MCLKSQENTIWRRKQLNVVITFNHLFGDVPFNSTTLESPSHEPRMGVNLLRLSSWFSAWQLKLRRRRVVIYWRRKVMSRRPRSTPTLSLQFLNAKLQQKQAWVKSVAIKDGPQVARAYVLRPHQSNDEYSRLRDIHIFAGWPWLWERCVRVHAM